MLDDKDCHNRSKIVKISSTCEHAFDRFLFPGSRTSSANQVLFGCLSVSAHVEMPDPCPPIPKLASSLLARAGSDLRFSTWPPQLKTAMSPLLFGLESSSLPRESNKTTRVSVSSVPALNHIIVFS